MKGQRGEKSKGYELMTVERLREFPGLENLSDHEARLVARTIQMSNRMQRGLTKTYNLFHSQYLTSVDIEKQKHATAKGV